MIYFDTDVLVHAFYEQDAGKHRESVALFEEAREDGRAAVSTLSIQETLFAIARFPITPQRNETIYETLMRLEPTVYTIGNLQRGVELARSIGFRHFNDCIHTAIAEEHCLELITYNRSEFGRMRNFTRLPITIL